MSNRGTLQFIVMSPGTVPIGESGKITAEQKTTSL